MMRTTILLLLLAPFVLAPGSTHAVESDVLVLRGDLRFAMVADPEASGATGLIVRDGRIAGYLTEKNPVPAGAKVLDYGKAYLLPGFVDACALTADARRDAPFALTPESRAIDGYDRFGRPDSRLAVGVTTMWLTPARNRLVTGIGAIVKTAGEDRVLRDAEGLRLTLGREGLNPPAVWEPPLYPDPFGDPIRPALPPPPSTRAAAAAMLREAFGETAKGALLEAREGRLRVRIHASTADEIRLAIRLVKELELTAVLELADASEARDALDEIRASGLPVVLEEGGPDAAKVLASIERAALANPTASPLVLAASAAVEQGWTELRAITIDAAKVLGVDDRVGSLDPGKDADVVVLDGEPLSTESSIRAVLIGGKVVHERKATPGLLAIRAGRVMTGDGGILEDAVIVCRDGKIVEMGRDVSLPPDAERHVWPGTVVPGFVDAWSHAGVPNGDFPGGVADAAVLEASALERMREGGVTSLVLLSRGAGVAPGLASVVSTTLAKDTIRVIRGGAALHVNLATPGDRAARALQFRDLLDGAKGYVAAWAAHEKAAAEAKAKGAKAPKAPRRDGRMDAWRKVAAGEIPILVRADRTEEVREALAIPERLGFGRVVLLGAAGGVRIAEDVAAAKAPTVLAGLPWIDLEGRGRVPVARTLVRAGVSVALGSGSTGIDPLSSLGEAVRQGVSPRAALAGLTAQAARTFGVEDRLGRLAPGLLADFVHLSSDPGEPGCHVVHVVAGGEVVHERKDPR